LIEGEWERRKRGAKAGVEWAVVDMGNKCSRLNILIPQESAPFSKYRKNPAKYPQKIFNHRTKTLTFGSHFIIQYPLKRTGSIKLRK
jgi:hypothetical protein